MQSSTEKKHASFICLNRIVHPHRDVAIASEGLHIFIYIQIPITLSSLGSSACYTNCDIGNPLKMVIFEEPLHLTSNLAFSSGAVTTVLTTGLSLLGFKHPVFFSCKANAQTVFDTNIIIGSICHVENKKKASWSYLK